PAPRGGGRPADRPRPTVARPRGGTDTAAGDADIAGEEAMSPVTERAPVAAPPPLEPPPAEPNYITASYGIWSWLLTIDHKRIGILYLVSISIFFVVGGTAARLVRLNLLTNNTAI